MVTSIVCANDGSAHADVGLVYAVELAKLTGASLTILTVNLALGGALWPLFYLWPEREAEAVTKKAAALAKAMGLTDVVATVIVARAAGPAIVSHANAIGADHIVVGCGKQLGVKRVALGSVAADVAGQATCSVTIAR